MLKKTLQTSNVLHTTRAENSLSLSQAARGDLHLIFIDDQIVVVVKMCGMTHVSPLNFLLLKSPFYSLLNKIGCVNEKKVQLKN